MTDYKRGINIYINDEFDKNPGKITISWSAYGACTINETKKFVKELSKTIIQGEKLKIK
jgi:hypothetical protein